MTTLPTPPNELAYLRKNDIRISDIRIINAGGLDIKLNKEHFQYFEILEDIFSSNLKGRMSIIDAANLPENLKLCGQEVLLVSFATNPNMEDINMGFVIDKISERLPLKNEQAQIYDIHFTFPTFMNNIRQRVSKAYDGPISETVKDIFKNTLNAYEGENAIPLFTELTYGDFPVIIPNWRPVPAINWLAKRAISVKNKMKSDYVFFQDLDGFRFMSLSTLKSAPVREIYESGPIRSRYVRPDPEGLADFDIPARNIEKLIIGGYDKSAEVMNGMYSSNMTVHDLLSKSIAKFKWNYQNEFISELSLNGHSLLNPWSDMYSPYTTSKEYLIPRHNGMFGGVVTVPSALGTPYADVNILEYAQGDNSELWVQSHESNKMQLKSSFIEIVVQGDTNRRVGDKVIVQINDHSSTTSKIDTTLTGNYLITKIKHKISYGGGHEMQMRLNKDSFIEPIPSSWEYEHTDSGVDPTETVLE
jgi:hypothetical protein